jgi:NOL1/NOP2/fmu family ribosome biogenesis protein
LPGFDPGHPEWRGWPQQVEEPEVSGDQAVGENHGQAATHGRSPEALRHTVRLWPHKVEGEGHFVALLRKRGDTAPAAWPLATPVRLASADEDALRDFWLPLISLSLPERLAVYPRSRTTVEVFALTPDSPDLAGLRTVRPGWHLGSLVHSTGAPGAGRSRFVPGHALALGLKSHEVRQRLDEPIGGELAARYLRGETLDVPGPDGWLLVTIAGFPLGWGKRSHGVIKNHYPKALRWL